MVSFIIIVVNKFLVEYLGDILERISPVQVKIVYKIVL